MMNIYSPSFSLFFLDIKMIAFEKEGKGRKLMSIILVHAAALICVYVDKEVFGVLEHICNCRKIIPVFPFAL